MLAFFFWRQLAGRTGGLLGSRVVRSTIWTIIEVVEEWRRTKSFLEWAPGPATNKRQTVSLGSGRSFVYKGGTYRNLVVDERHYAPADLAKVWGVDVETIRNLFREEPGVVKIGEKAPRYKRSYLTLRIPESVAVRVHKRLSE
jgi:hypothetical protein